DFLLCDSTPGELFRLSLCASVVQNAVSRFMKRAYRLEAFLAPFFTAQQYALFQELQAVTGLLISGSVALQFFMRIWFDNSDLDLYVHHRHIAAMHEFLVGAGYAYLEAVPSESFPATKERLDSVFQLKIVCSSDNTSAKYSGRGVFAVLHYTKADGTKVDLITTLYCPFQVILGFHSTCIMNIITYAHAVSLYPHATFLEGVSYQNKAVKHSDDAAFKKYTDRGFSYLTRDEALTRTEFRFQRRVGDRFSWIIPLR
ncbi:uncharacterized protein EV420DRAFT_1230751, partial [Desarmillaria tabescens]